MTHRPMFSYRPVFPFVLRLICSWTYFDSIWYQGSVWKLWVICSYFLLSFHYNFIFWLKWLLCEIFSPRVCISLFVIFLTDSKLFLWTWFGPCGPVLKLIVCWIFPSCLMFSYPFHVQCLHELTWMCFGLCEVAYGVMLLGAVFNIVSYFYGFVDFFNARTIFCNH